MEASTLARVLASATALGAEPRKDALSVAMSEVIEPLVALPTRSSQANLDLPRPGFVCLYYLGDRARCIEHRRQHLPVAREGHVGFRRPWRPSAVVLGAVCGGRGVSHRYSASTWLRLGWPFW